MSDLRGSSSLLQRFFAAVLITGCGGLAYGQNNNVMLDGNDIGGVVTSSNGAVATASVSGSVLTVTLVPNGNGSTTIAVTATDTGTPVPGSVGDPAQADRIVTGTLPPRPS